MEDAEIHRLIETAAQEIARASFAGPLDERMVNTRLVVLVDAVLRLARMPPAARELLASVETWREKLRAAASPRKRSARIERLDVELAQLQHALANEPGHDSTPEQYDAFLETLGHRLGRAVAQLLVRLANERKPRKP